MVGSGGAKATIKFVISEQELTDAVDAINASAQYIIDNNIAPVMSVSFGICEQFESNALINAMWQQAAAEGITVSVSSGDNGSAGCDDPSEASAGENATAQNPAQGIAVSGTASTPFNVAVGGTDFDDATTQNTFWNSTNTSATQASAIGYIPEIPWNDSCATSGLSGCTNAPACSPLLALRAERLLREAAGRARFTQRRKHRSRQASETRNATCLTFRFCRGRIEQEFLYHLRVG